MVEKANLKVRDKEIEIPLFTGTENETALDISRLRGETGRENADEQEQRSERLHA